MCASTFDPHRRATIASALTALVPLASAQPTHEQPRSRKALQQWYESAVSMKRLAESRGDQPYGAVLVIGDAIVGEGPSRVVLHGDPDAHAEREAIRDAQRRLGRDRLAGSILVSTSRPCRQCERAAAQAGVSRMIHGSTLLDAGAPSP